MVSGTCDDVGDLFRKFLNFVLLASVLSECSHHLFCSFVLWVFAQQKPIYTYVHTSIFQRVLIES